MGLTMDQKVTVVKLIREKKDLLWGKFANTVTSAEKDKTWKSIIQKCKADCGFDPTPNGKPWKYLRDKTWANWKSNTLAKRDKYSQTGTEGGEDALYNEVR